MIFTSHYVSINSIVMLQTYLLIQNLHPTMYLLILGTVAVAKLVKIQFTSHYVSINSRFV